MTAPLLSMQRDRQALRRRPGAARRLARGRAGRGHGAGRPERRRQVDDDQDPDRRLPRATPATIAFDGAPGAVRLAAGGAGGRHHARSTRRSTSIPLPLGGREHLPRPRAARASGCSTGRAMNREARRAAARASTSTSTCARRSAPIQHRHPADGGDRPRRVASRRKLVIMDEPTSSLDEREVEVLFDMIRTLKADRRRRSSSSATSSTSSTRSATASRSCATAAPSP